MPRKAKKAETFKEKSIEAMKNLGVYRAEYDQVIDVYSKLLERYEELKATITIADYQKRTPAVISLENLRRDIAKYSDLLCLNPHIFEKTKVKEKPKLSKFEQALAKL